MRQLEYLIAAMIFLLLAGGAGAVTLTVDDSGGAMYTRIQDAINASNVRDTILVYSGRYYEQVIVTKQLILQGINTGGGNPVVDAGGNGSAITLVADGVVVEGFTVANSYFGIGAISNQSIIRNNIVSNNSLGIFLMFSHGNILSNNSVSNNIIEGIFLLYSDNNILGNNIMTGNMYNFGIYGESSIDFNNQIDISNLVDGKPIYYIIGASNSVYDSSTNAGTFYCINCINVTIKDMDFNNNLYGIFLWNTSFSKILGMHVSNNANGISLLYSHGNTLSNNDVVDNYDGISLMYTISNTLISNYVSNNSVNGVSLTYAINSTLAGNNASNNGYDGFSLLYSYYSTLSNNYASNNYNGVSVSYSSNDTLNNNIMTRNKYNFGIYGNSDSDFNNLIDISNMVDGKPIYYVKGASNNIYDSSTNAGTFYCIYCINVIIKNMDMDKNNNGIFFWKTNLSSILNVNASNNYDAISLLYSNGNTLGYNNASNNDHDGLSLGYSSDNTVTNNNASNNKFNGIYLHSSNGNILTENTALKNKVFDFVSVLDSIDNYVVNLTIGSTISFVGKDVGIRSASLPANDPAGFKNIDKFVGAINTSDKSWLLLFVNYKESDISGLNESSLRLWRYYGSWSQVAGINGVNRTLKVVGANVTEYGFFAPMAESGVDSTTQIDKCTTISSTGTYVLARDIVNSTVNPCINITSSNVALDGADFTIDGVNAQNTGISVGMHANSITNVTVRNLKVKNWKFGIWYTNITSGLITNNTASSNDFGIIMTSSSETTLINNRASLNNVGIYVDSSNINRLSSNIANLNNNSGIILVNSDSNIINSNIVNSNTWYGVYLNYSSNNLISNNNLNNTNNIQDNRNNIWNTTKTSGMTIIGSPYLGGNFWANPDNTGFSQTCADSDRDGICDLPYTLNTNNIDNLPLVYSTSSILSPEVAAWDASNDGIIQKSEAVAAVVNYFSPGGISKADAIAVVVAYFRT